MSKTLKTVDRSTLVDINDVTIDLNQPKEQRVQRYLEQIGNPYLFKCGECVVSTRFAKTNATLQDRLVAYARSAT